MAELKESRTALGVAWMRAAHQVLDSKPLILEDEPIVDLLGRYYVERLCKAPGRMQVPGVRMLRAHVVLRSRFAEDRLQESIARGVRQYIVLGAGYDTFFARQPSWAQSLQVFEIDQPATQADKLARITAAKMSIPPNVVFGSVDFENESLEDGLRRHGVRLDVPTLFSWLGVTMYLTEPAIDAVLRTVARFAAGSEIVFTFANKAMQPITYNLELPGGKAGTPPFDTAASAPPAAPDGLPDPPNTMPGMPSAVTLAGLAAAAGEPWLTYFEPEELARKLRETGFANIEFLTPEMSAARYFAGREDALPSPARSSIVSAMNAHRQQESSQ